MCYQERCFNFDDYFDKKVAIFISGPGHLEYPWALETALRLKQHGASVHVFDISEFALKYSARIRFRKHKLPFQSRLFLRKIFLTHKNRIENVFAQICKEYDVSHSYYRSRNKVSYSRQNKQIQIAEVQKIQWGSISASEIIRTVFSGRQRKLMKLDDFVDLHSIQELEASVLETNHFLHDFPVENFDAIFLANGRQPVQLTLTIYFRGKQRNVILYESGGGTIFPEFLTPHIEYWTSSPANVEETKGKILCPFYNKSGSEDVLAKLVNSLKVRSHIPFSINYLTTAPESFDPRDLKGGANYAFFTTSDWEFSFLYNRVLTPETFRTQFEVVDFLINHLGPEDKLFIRIHPSDPDLNFTSESEWQRYSRDQKVQVISSESRMNSFELAKSMDANFVWSSFIGFELILQNQKVGVFGDAVYADLIGNNWIPTPKRATKFLSSLSHVVPAKVIPYANYLAFGGFEINSSKVSSNREIFLHGKKVDELRRFLHWAPERLRVKIS